MRAGEEYTCVRIVHPLGQRHRSYLRTRVIYSGTFPSPQDGYYRNPRLICCKKEWMVLKRQSSLLQGHPTRILLVFSVTPLKIDQNQNQNHSTDKVQNLENERRYIYKDPRQDSGQRNISYTRYLKKCFTQTYRDLYGDTMLVLTLMSSNMADGNQQKHLLPSFATNV